MAKYHLVHTDSKGTFFNLTRLEMVNKLKQVKDLQNWFCWYPGLPKWKQVSQAHEIKEWMAIPWTEDQPMPPWQELFAQRGKMKEDFDIVEFNDPQLPLNPPPLPPDGDKTEFVISGFSGQVFDFDETISGKTQPGTEGSGKFENTVKVDTTSDFDKTIAGSTQLISDKTAIMETTPDLDKTVAGVSTADLDKTVAMQTPSISDKTVKVDTSGQDFDKTIGATTTLTTEKTITSLNAGAPSFDNTNKVVIPKENESVFDQITQPGIKPVAPPVVASVSMPDKSTPPTPGDLAHAANNAFAKKHDRRYPRIKGRLRTIITNKSKAFMTFTKDISLGGIQVENMIPHDLLNSEIEVYLSDPTGKKSILFRCHPVGDMKNPCRFSFAKADEKNLQKLSQWLDDLAKIGAA